MKHKRTEYERQQYEFSRGEQELRKAGYLFGDESRRITSRIGRMTPREVDEALQKRNRDLHWLNNLALNVSAGAKAKAGGHG